MNTNQDKIYESFIDDVRKVIYSDNTERLEVSRISAISEAVDLQQRIEENNVILYGLS